MRAGLFAFLALLSVPGLAEDASFKNWDVSCDARSGYCAATAAAGDDILRIARHGEQSYWEVSFVARSAQPDEWQDFVVTVDGEPETFSLRSEVGAYGAVSDFYFLGPRAQHVMDLMMPGSEVSIGYTDTASNPHSVAFPLAGLSAALLWIDEKQGRLGSERVASIAPYGLTPAGQEQTEVPVLPQDVLDRHAADTECEPFEELANGRDIIIAALDAENTLYLVPCWSGAYNFGWKAYVRSGIGLEAVYFADYSDYTGWTGTPFLVNVHYDPELKVLGTYNKARGVADCGSSGSWKWTGYLFRLEEFRSKECDDGPVDENAEMGEFPVIFSAPPLPPNG